MNKFVPTYLTSKTPSFLSVPNHPFDFLGLRRKKQWMEQICNRLIRIVQKWRIEEKNKFSLHRPGIASSLPQLSKISCSFKLRKKPYLKYLKLRNMLVSRGIPECA